MRGSAPLASLVGTAYPRYSRMAAPPPLHPVNVGPGILPILRPRPSVPARARPVTFIAALLLGLAASSCAPTAVQTSPTRNSTPAAGIYISDRLYFGRSIPGGGAVSDVDWDGFLREVVTPRFPAGLTVWRAEGQWRDDAGAIVREASFVLELIHPASIQSDSAVQAIIAEYRRRFRQEAVLRVRDHVQVMD